MSEENRDDLYARLKQVFHEPSRLSIMSALAEAASGMTFTELKKTCNLTDGNLSRHLTTLQDAKVVNVDKRFVGVKPRTTVTLSRRGRDDFVEYLNNLATVLLKASEALENPGRRKAKASDDLPLSDAAEA